MKAIKESDFEEYGCVTCGCEFCYLSMQSSSEAIVECAECHTRFMIFREGKKIADTGIGKTDYKGFILPSEKESAIDTFSQINFSDEKVLEQLKNGIAIEKDGFLYFVLGPHPRKGIAKHELVIPDIRPENLEGDYCYPRGVGYDVACFVKSKQAGERITEMINKLNQEYEEKGFSCWLDYREDEPLWIQVKIDYPDELRAQYLIDLIKLNDYIITEDIVREAINENIDNLDYNLEEKKEYKKIKR